MRKGTREFSNFLNGKKKKKKENLDLSTRDTLMSAIF